MALFVRIMEKEDRFQISFDRKVAEVLFDLNISVALSTYQAGRIVVIGSLDGDRLHQIPVPFKRPMGIAVDGNQLAVACLDEVQFLSNNAHIAEQKKLNDKEFDAFFVHRATYNTATIDIHDIAFGKGKLWAVNTSFSCLCTLDITSSFIPKWKPDFITTLIPEDRCHLNGMAMKEGLPRYVTALGSSDEKEGWRKDMMSGGVLLEVPSGNVILSGLAMPHSPRFYQDSLYLLTSGSGKFLKVDSQKGTYDELANFNCFIRGLSFYGKYAFIGMSKIRESSKSFKSLDVCENSKNAGLIVFDMENEEEVGRILYHSTIEEIYDVHVFSEHMRPAIINSNDERSKQIIYFDDQVFWKKVKTETKV